jgi:hypothetical protein
VLTTRAWYAFLRENIDQSVALRRYRCWLRDMSA